MPFRKTHGLIELGRQCAELNSEMETLLPRAAVLSEYAWKFRYPGDADKPTSEEADEAIGLARELYLAISAQLPEEIIGE